MTVIGNLVDDPELRFTASGVAMAKIRMAVNRRYQRSGEWQEETSFFGGTLWRDAAENAAESLQKGMRVIVTGRLEQRSGRPRRARSAPSSRSPSTRSVLRCGGRRPPSPGRRGPATGYGGGGSEQGMPAAPVARDDYGPDEAPF